jgi:queuine tRNA-ribosyltransferase
LRNAKFADDFSALDPECDCAACSTFSRAYIAHLFRAGELLAARLTSIHNVAYLVRFAAEARAAILAGRFAEYSAERTALLAQR